MLIITGRRFKILETKIDAKKTALLVIDMQNGFIKAKEEPINELAKMAESKGVVNNIAKVIAAARQVVMPVVFTGHVHRKDEADIIPTITDTMLQGVAPSPVMIEGTHDGNIVDELKPAPEDYIIWKRRSNAFYQTDLEIMLRARGIDTVILTGVVTNACVYNTLRGARERDLHVIVLSDCCAARTLEDDEYYIKKAFPWRGRVRTSDEIVAAIVEKSVASY